MDDFVRGYFERRRRGMRPWAAATCAVSEGAYELWKRM